MLPVSGAFQTFGSICQNWLWGPDVDSRVQDAILTPARSSFLSFPIHKGLAHHMLPCIRTGLCTCVGVCRCDHRVLCT